MPPRSNRGIIVKDFFKPVEDDLSRFISRKDEVTEETDECVYKSEPKNKIAKEKPRFNTKLGDFRSEPQEQQTPNARFGNFRSEQKEQQTPNARFGNFRSEQPVQQPVQPRPDLSRDTFNSASAQPYRSQVAYKQVATSAISRDNFGEIKQPIDKVVTGPLKPAGRVIMHPKRKIENEKHIGIPIGC